jgi:hypothetical protein
VAEYQDEDALKAALRVLTEQSRKLREDLRSHLNSVHPNGLIHARARRISMLPPALPDVAEDRRRKFRPPADDSDDRST